MALSRTESCFTESKCIYVVFNKGGNICLIFNNLFYHHSGVIGNVIGWIHYYTVFTVNLAGCRNCNAVYVFIAFDYAYNFLNKLLTAFLCLGRYCMPVGKIEFFVTNSIFDICSSDIECQYSHSITPYMYCSLIIISIYFVEFNSYWKDVKFVI